MSDPVLSILSKPLGPPVYANQLLAPKLTFLPVLSNVEFSQDNWLVGLDNCEDKRARDRAELTFRGVITINTMTMLSKDGQQVLQSFLTKRSSPFDLKRLISTGRLKVQVQGIVQGIPSYKTRDDSFQLDCKDETRSRTLTFRVNNLAKECYLYSQKFLARYQALHELMSVVSYDDALPANMRTPVKERTVHWLVEGFAKLASRSSRGVKRSDHRYIHGSTVRSIFAPHAEWLKREIIDRKGILNKASWNRFCEEYRARKAANSQDMDMTAIDELWGEEEDLMEVDNANEDEQIENLDSNYDIINGYIDTYTYADGDRSVPLKEHLAKHSSCEKEGMPIDEQLVAQLPKEFFTRPQIPTDFIWKCTIDQCSCVIELHDLTPEDLQGMDIDDQAYLTSCKWVLGDERFRELFFDMVERHWSEHWDRMGVRMTAFGTGEVDKFGNKIRRERVITGPGQLREDDNPRYEWIHPEAHVHISRDLR